MKFDYLVIKYKINRRAYKDDMAFLADLYTTVMGPNVVDAINNYVDTNYVSNLTNEEVVNKYNKGLEFTDKHCKILYKVSSAAKYFIPLLLEFVQYYPEVQKNVSDFLLQAYDRLFVIFGEGTNIINKLIESVRSRVLSTKYSDKFIWRYYEIHGYNIEQLAYGLVRKIVHDIIPKYVFEKNIISFNHVVIYKNIEYFFQYNFPMTYKSIDISKQDDGLSDFDKLMIKTAKVNESETICREVNAMHTVQFLLKKHKMNISTEELDFYKKTRIFKLQKTLLFLYFAKYFGSFDSLYGCDVNAYMQLLVMLKRILKNNGFRYLPKILTAKVIPINEKKVLSKKNIMKVVESKKYKDLLSNKYKFAANNILNSDVIIKTIGILLNNAFAEQEYGGGLTNGETITYSVNAIIEEYLSFIEMI
jgi:hypothetical protein